MSGNPFYLINPLCWLFVIGVLLSIVFSILVFVYYKRSIEEERALHREEMSELRKDYYNRTTDLTNRLMAGSYAEYEAFNQKEEGPRKPTPSNNFIKRSIDQANQDRARERMETGDED